MLKYGDPATILRPTAFSSALTTYWSSGVGTSAISWSTLDVDTGGASRVASRAYSETVGNSKTRLRQFGHGTVRAAAAAAELLMWQTGKWQVGNTLATRKKTSRQHDATRARRARPRQSARRAIAAPLFYTRDAEYAKETRTLVVSCRFLQFCFFFSSFFRFSSRMAQLTRDQTLSNDGRRGRHRISRIAMIGAPRRFDRNTNLRDSRTKFEREFIRSLFQNKALSSRHVSFLFVRFTHQSRR